MSKANRRHYLGLRTASLCSQGVNRKCVLRKYGIGPLRQKSFCRQFQYVVGTIAQGYLLRFYTVTSSQFGLQGKTVRVRVTAQIGRSLRNRSLGFFTQPQGIFIGGQLDHCIGVETQFSNHVRHRFTGLVGGNGTNELRGLLGQFLHGAAFSCVVLPGTNPALSKRMRFFSVAPKLWPLLARFDGLANL